MEGHRILTIQDVSCVGQCSTTVALPILSACGHETCILPTALLSTHTGGFQSPAVCQLADGMAGIREHWQRENIRFDAIYTGYLGSVAAIEEAETIISELLVPGGTVFADPAMADHGKLYKGLDREYAKAMENLCRKADWILPNITEAAMFAGLPYEKEPDRSYLENLLKGLHHPGIILTGAGTAPEETGAAIYDHGKRSDCRHRKLPGSYHGTGDLFASCCIGAYLRGISLPEAVNIAADMVCLSIQNTPADHWYGVRFETAIPELVRRLSAGAGL